MKRLLGGACALVFALCAVQAHAGDYKGFYIGGNVGGGSGNSDARTSTVFSPTGYFATSSIPAIASSGAQSLSPSGVIGGGQAGYNFQHNSFVLGVETDFDGSNMSDLKSITTAYPCCPTTNFTIKQFVGADWLYTLRGRLGYTKGPLLVYGTGGLAVSSVEYTAVFTDTFLNARENARETATQSGWSAGAGAEIKTGKHWSWRAEYLRVDLGDEKFGSTNLTVGVNTHFPQNVFTHSFNLTGNLYRFGFNYRF
jgi:outer membrane immunogenic protein